MLFSFRCGKESRARVIGMTLTDYNNTPTKVSFISSNFSVPVTCPAKRNMADTGLGFTSRPHVKLCYGLCSENEDKAVDD